MKKFYVYHTSKLIYWRMNNENRQYETVFSLIGDKPVASVMAESLDEVYTRTQHGIMSTINAPNGFVDSANWIGLQREGIMVYIRSTSEGDVITDGENVWIVGNVGFDHVGLIKAVNKRYGTSF